MAAKVRRRMVAAKLGVSVAFFGLLSGLGVKLGETASASEAADGPRASSSAVRTNSIGTSQIRNGSLRLRDFKSREVFSFKQGQRLRANIADVLVKVDAFSLKLDGLSQKFEILQHKDVNIAADVLALGNLLSSKFDGLSGEIASKYQTLSGEIAAVAGKFENVVSGRGSVFTATESVGSSAETIAEIPGFGRLDVFRHPEGNATEFTFKNTSGGDIVVGWSWGASETVPNGGSTTAFIDSGLETLQLLDFSTPTGTPAVATATLSDMLVPKGDQPPGHQAVAQILIGL